MTTPTPPGAEPSRWLDAEQQRHWRALAALLIRLPAALDTDLQEQAGISHFEYLVLSALSEAPERTLRMSTLAGYTSASLSRLSHVVRRLEQRDWVRRSPCPDDGRATNATLTDAGYAKVAATAPGHVRTVRELVIDALDPEQLRDLGTIAVRVLARVDGEPDPGGR
ncbi:MarR family winged helix-turn-helix transcriptional regulator [Melissospora conviva]|uniref:MarR family winged helix-turn-helix transcriptional regulator n=1 Tax=Melissospora conviva TaxID=3388432 RepID=UPI003B7CB354